MRLWDLAKRNFKEIIRDPVALGLLLGMPVVIMLVMGLAFGSQTFSQDKLAVVDMDNSSTSRAFIEQGLGGAGYSSALKVVVYNTLEKAVSDFRDRKLDGVLVIPSGLGQEVANYQAGEKTEVTLDLITDQTDYALAGQLRSLVESAFLQFFQFQMPLNIDTQAIDIGVKSTFLNFIAPGIIIFGMMILIPTVSRRTVVDKERGFLPRMLTTPARSRDFISGYSLPLVLVALIQLVVYIGLAKGLGWEIYGGGMSQASNMAVAFGIFLIMGLCSIGIGMAIASVMKTENQSDALGWILIVTLAMLSSAWFPTSGMPSAVKAFANVLPPTHAVRAVRDVVNLGAGLGAIWGDLTYVIVSTVILFILGVVLFRRSMAS